MKLVDTRGLISYIPASNTSRLAIFNTEMNSSNPKNHSTVAVLGAGIMGCCLALELSRRGYSVDLIDQAPSPMTGASLHNEGKLHLGFVYAKDPLRATHTLMLRGSLAFSRIFEQITGYGPETYLVSQPFHYFVPSDSQLDMGAISDHFYRVEEGIHEETESTGDNYLGHRYRRYFERNSSRVHRNLFALESTLGSFRTEERAVSPTAVANILCQTVARKSNIRFMGNTEIRAANRIGDSDVDLELSRGGEAFYSRYSAVANCLWDDRLRIDHSAGISPERPWLFRYKATIRIAAHSNGHNGIPSATGIIGAYGDVVNHNDGTYYLSWYPTCKVAQTMAEDGRSLHAAVHRGFINSGLRALGDSFPSIRRLLALMGHQKLVKESIRGMEDYIPSVKYLLNYTRRSEVGGGVIFAWGVTDIDDPDSILHQRSQIGPVSYGTYVTVDTGKYCMAPLFAIETADILERVLPRTSGKIAGKLI